MFKAGDDVIITRKNKKVQYDIKGKKVVQGIHSTAATYDCR
jgi:sortase (surface protein transpeptidase)